MNGDNSDLVSIHGVTLLPDDGWPVNVNTGVGFSIVRPYEVTMELDSIFNHSSIIKDRIVLGEDAMAVIYDHYDWKVPVNYVERLDKDLNWKEEVHVYIAVTSANKEFTRYYDVAVRIPGA
ncbi:MAG: hypothetical protein FWH28_06905 [Clostridiales bacterium]|nr:hypothetical protein [Clostridiales bacterium]